LLRWRNLVCLPMSLLLPVSVMAQDTGGAILHSSDNGVLVNKSSAPASTAIFPDDLVETPKNVMARIELPGSSAQLNGETMVQFHQEELVLDHGSVSVNTSRGLRVRVGCITVTPVYPDQWTQFDVVDTDGKVTVSALKSDVYIDEHRKNLQPGKEPDQRDRTIVHEGEQKSREERCAGAYLPSNVSGAGAILNSPWTIGVAAAVVGTVACLGLCHGDDPLSPHKP
jgi:hypothetical protein